MASDAGNAQALVLAGNAALSEAQGYLESANAKVEEANAAFQQLVPELVGSLETAVKAGEEYASGALA